MWGSRWNPSQKPVLRLPLCLCPPRVVSSTLLTSSLSMSPSDGPSASTSLLSSRRTRPADIGYLHSDIPGAAQTYICHLKLSPFPVFSRTSWSAPLQDTWKPCRDAPPAAAPLAPFQSLTQRCPYASEWSDCPPGKYVSYFYFLPLIPHVLN